MEHKSLTIFTPTFNRVHTLPLLYESLRIQTCKDFRWVIVDDGSTDRTSSVVEKWIEEKLVDIEYHFQENSGKMAAHNFAVDKSDTEWFMCLDSDDRLADEDTVADCLDFFRQADSEDICGIISYKSFGSGHNVFPKGMEKVHLEELRRAGFMGELVMTMKTSILKKHKFPKFGNEKFVTDSFLYERLDKDFSFALMDRVVQICQYNPDGYSYNYRQILFSNPQGYRAYHNQRIALGFSGKIKSAICYDAISVRMGFKGFFADAAAPFLYLAMLPAGVRKYLLDSLHLRTFRSLS